MAGTLHSQCHPFEANCGAAKPDENETAFAPPPKFLELIRTFKNGIKSKSLAMDSTWDHLGQIPGFSRWQKLCPNSEQFWPL
jgi:hypothetical protein